MKQLTLSLLILFSSCVFAETYFCTQKSQTQIFTNRDEFDKDIVQNIEVSSKDIFKLQIDHKNKIVLFAKLEEFNKLKNIKSLDYKINLFLGEKGLMGVTANRFFNIEEYLEFANDSLIFADLDKPKQYLITTHSSIVLTVHRNYECSKEE